MLHFLNDVYRFFWPVVTYHWCVVSAIGCTLWRAEYKKCYNGEPAGAGWFLTIIKGENWTQEDAEQYARELTEEAKKWKELNKDRD